MIIPVIVYFVSVCIHNMSWIKRKYLDIYNISFCTCEHADWFHVGIQHLQAKHKQFP